jgi:hypothetical protein
MARQRTQEEWLAVIAEYKASGLTVREFCREKRTCPSHFSKRMKEIEIGSSESLGPAFVRAVPVAKKVTKPLSSEPLSLRYKESTLVFTQLPDVSWVSAALTLEMFQNILLRSFFIGWILWMIVFQ